MAQLNQDQTAAAQRFFAFMMDKKEKMFVIKGPAGTGKSTLVKHILDQLPAQEKALRALGQVGWFYKEIFITATTRKAAQVISKLNNCDPVTIHSLLGLRVHNDRLTGKTSLKLNRNAEPIRNALVIIDEASFVDHELLLVIQSRCIDCKVVFIGDPYQLLPTATSVCPVFDGSLPTVELKQIMRNEGAIERISGAFRDTVKTGNFSDIEPDHDLVKHVDGPTFQQMVDQAYLDPDYNPDKVKLLAWTNSRVHEYNDYIRTLKGYQSTLSKGEYVITNKPIMAGNTTAFATDASAVITSVSTYSREYLGIAGQWVTLSGKQEVFVPDDPFAVKREIGIAKKAKDWSRYFSLQEDIADLRPPYACTVHKSQGSTYNTVFIDLSDIGRCNIPTDVARMMYVAISRASAQVVLYGQLPAKYRGITDECLQQSA